MNSANPQAGAPAPQKKSNTGLIIGIVVVVLLCCCCLIAGGGFAYYRSMQAATAFSSFATSMPSVPSGSGAGGAGGAVAGIPTGGNGNETDRAQAWTMALAAIVQNNPMSCTQPDADKTTIDVTKQPDSSGAWEEQWTVACDGADSIKVDVTFTPAGGGVNTVTAKLAK